MVDLTKAAIFEDRQYNLFTVAFRQPMTKGKQLQALSAYHGPHDISVAARGVNKSGCSSQQVHGLFLVVSPESCSPPILNPNWTKRELIHLDC